MRYSLQGEFGPHERQSLLSEEEKVNLPTEGKETKAEFIPSGAAIETRPFQTARIKRCVLNDLCLLLSLAGSLPSLPVPRL